MKKCQSPYFFENMWKTFLILNWNNKDINYILKEDTFKNKIRIGVIKRYLTKRQKT